MRALTELVNLCRVLAADSDAEARTCGESQRDWYQGRAAAFRFVGQWAGARLEPKVLSVLAVRQDNPSDPTDAPNLCVG